MKNIYRFTFILTVIVLTAACVLLFEKSDKPEKIYVSETTAVAESEETEVTFNETDVSELLQEEDVYILSEKEEADKTDAQYEIAEENVQSENTFDENFVSENEAEEKNSQPDGIINSDEEALREEKEEISENITEAEKIEYIEIEKPGEKAYFPGSGDEIVTPLSICGENKGALEYATAVNTYTFRLEKRGRISYSVAHGENLTAGWCVTLYEEYYINGDEGDRGYRVINVLNTKSTAGTDRSVEIGLMAGNYRIVVTQGSGHTADEYSLTVDISYGSEYEIECNDNIYRYTEIYSSVSLKGTASYFTDKQDEDYYMFRMFEDGYAELQFSFPVENDKTTVCWQVFFYSEDGKTFYAEDFRFSDGGGTSGPIGLPKGNYFVVVRNRVYTDTTYTLTARRTAESSFEVGDNDTKENANRIDLNSTVSGSLSYIKNSFDKDWFKFVVSENGYCSVEFAHEAISDSDGKEGWNITLMTESEEVLYTDISLWASDIVSSPDIGLGTGTYYIKIDPEDRHHNEKTYFLTVNFTAAENYETEANNSFSSADELIQGSAKTGFIATVGSEHEYDYYTFTLSGGGDVTVTFSHEALSHNKDIFAIVLYDENRKAVGNPVKILGNEENVSAQFSALQSGKYYIRVGTGLFSGDISYNISYNVSTGG